MKAAPSPLRGIVESDCPTDRAGPTAIGRGERRRWRHVIIQHFFTPDDRAIMIRSSSIHDNERAARGSTLPWLQVRGSLKLDAAGLIPAIAQQHGPGEVLMLAWMNLEAIAETLATGRVCYYSRSRSRLWRKGETSGQVQHLREMRI